MLNVMFLVKYLLRKNCLALSHPEYMTWWLLLGHTFAKWVENLLFSSHKTEISPSTDERGKSCLIHFLTDQTQTSSAMQIILQHFHTQFTRVEKFVCYLQQCEQWWFMLETAGNAEFNCTGAWATIGNDTCYNGWRWPTVLKETTSSSEELFGRWAEEKNWDSIDNTQHASTKKSWRRNQSYPRLQSNSKCALEVIDRVSHDSREGSHKRTILSSLNFLVTI